MRRSGEHAIVLGASMAGLAMASALAPRFDRVTVVDRDVPSDVVEPRRGVPQGRHIHVLLPGGMSALETYLPELTDDLLAAGGLLLDSRTQLRMHLAGGWLHPPANDGLRFIAASRPLIETVVRRRVMALPNVTVRDGQDVRGLAVDDDGRVRGARLLARRPGSAEEVLTADLVVDATGRGSRSERWLGDRGFPQPETDIVDVGVRYATRLFHHEPGDLGGVQELLVSAVPSGRGGIAQVIEGDRWMVTLVGYLGDAPPADAEGFADFAASLDVPHLHELVSRAHPVSDVVTASYPASQRRRYERLRRFPEGLVVVGDAVCSFNPTYGQGMSVAALEAQHLGEVLDDGGLSSVGPRFFAASQPTIDIAWDLAIGNDVRLDGVAADRTRFQRITDRYGDRVVRAAHRDAAVSAAFHQVLGLVEPPQSLLAPRIARRVLRPGAASAPAVRTTPAPVRPTAPAR